MHSFVKGSSFRSGKLLCLCFVVAFIVVTLMSTCSFLYPTNTWGDAQCFYTVGKTIAQGKVLYRDIYEQKGPLLYFLHACVEWIPGTNVNPFLEIYILEVAAATATLFFLMKTLALYCGWKPRILAYLPLLCMLVYCNYSFVGGDSAEEFSLVANAYVLYATMSMLQSERPELSRGMLYCMGLLCGVVFWIKYTCLVFAFGALIVLLAVAIRERNGRLIGRAVVFMLLGALTASTPVFLYFAAHDAFGALWEAYFYNNLFAYPQDFRRQLSYTAYYLVYFAYYNSGYLLFALGGWIYFLRRKWNAQACCILCIVAAFVVVTIMGGRIFIYYWLPMAPLAVVGIACLDALLVRLQPARARRLALGAVSLILCVWLSLPLWNRNIGQKREDVPSYQVVASMERTPETTLLDLSFLDSGIYTAGDFVPTTRFFCRLNLVLPEMVEEWERIIRNGEVDYIYTGVYTLEDYCPPEEQAAYTLISDGSGEQRLYRLNAA